VSRLCKTDLKDPALASDLSVFSSAASGLSILYSVPAFQLGRGVSGLRRRRDEQNPALLVRPEKRPVDASRERGPEGHRRGSSLLVLRFRRDAFTLLEVMVAVAFIGLAMLALLSLHHSNLLAVARARELTQAAMLAQALMTDAEESRFPEPGRLIGDFQKMFPGRYFGFRWQRNVVQSEEFPDICQVRITVFYGPGFGRTFVLTEFMHNPLPQVRLPGPANAPQDTDQEPQGSTQ
jgi:type II secretion system protein I